LLERFITVTGEEKHRSGLASRVLQRGGGLPAIGQTTLRIAISTMRRGLDNEHVYETLDSLLPYLGSHGPLHVGVTVVDVERGEGSFAGEIKSKYKELVDAGLLTVQHLDDDARAVLYDALGNIMLYYIIIIIIIIYIYIILY
jgi:hypothetical protein